MITKLRPRRLPSDHPVIQAGHRVRVASQERDRAEEALLQLRLEAARAGRWSAYTERYEEAAQRLGLAMTDAAVAFEEWAEAIAILKPTGGANGRSSQG